MTTTATAPTFARIGTGRKVHRAIAPDLQGGVICGKHRDSRSGFRRMFPVRAIEISKASHLCVACFGQEAADGNEFDLGILGLSRLASVDTPDPEGGLGIREINDAKAQPAYLRERAAEFDESGMTATAADYREAADTVEMLLNALGLPAFRS